MSIENTHHGAKIAASWLALAKRVVMLGIGGVGMYGIASELKRRGKTVVGEDKTPNHLTRTLALGGVLVLLGEEHLPLGEGDVLVYTNAISKDHPTYQKAQSMGIPILSRAEALAGLASSYSPEIAIAGVHGKTTVTTMTGHILTEGGLDPTIFCGGIMKNENSPYRAGNGGVVYEACEYMQSFLAFTPEIGVVLNIEWEHVDAYPTPESIDVAFERFAFQSEHLVAPLEVCSRGRFCEHPHLYTFSLHDRGAFCYAKDMRHKKGRYHFTLCQNGEEIDEISLLVQGEFQIKNALASSVVGRLCGVDGTSICRSLSSETGAKRRLEHRGFLGKTPVFDDYAHHPTEISASLSALRASTEGKLICVFQPHTYSRTAAFLDELARALDLADVVALLPIYGAREENVWGVSSLDLAKKIGAKATAYPGFSAIVPVLPTIAGAGDILVIMGAGDISMLFSLLPITLP